MIIKIWKKGVNLVFTNSKKNDKMIWRERLDNCINYILRACSNRKIKPLFSPNFEELQLENWNRLQKIIYSGSPHQESHCNTSFFFFCP